MAGASSHVAQMRARVRKQDVVDERDRRRRALDVEQHDADAALGQRSRHTPSVDAAGKYAGPKQTGWKLLSTPLCV